MKNKKVGTTKKYSNESLDQAVVVILVDNKKRDLWGAGLIAYQLEKYGYKVFLEPLEAYKAVAFAYKPDFILFNHLLASHLVAWSIRLKQLGILVGVYLNEGLLYDENIRKFNAGKNHNNAHIDVIFCWNKLYKKELLAVGFKSDIYVVGVARFDYYFSPWKDILPVPQNENKTDGLPRLLVATNFGLADYYTRDKSRADTLFAGWKDHISHYKDYWEAIKISYESRSMWLKYMAPIVVAKKYNIIVKIHPAEDIAFYNNWLNTLTEEQKKYVCLDTKNIISSLIVHSDLELSGDTCTTALEAWLLKKPTLELGFQSHPILTVPEHNQHNIICHDPHQLVAMIDKALTVPIDDELSLNRAKHLEKWLDAHDGTASKKIADYIVEKVKIDKKEKQAFSLTEMRKGMKLLLLNCFDLPYSWQPHMKLRRFFQPKKSEKKYIEIEKSVTHKDVVDVMEKLHLVENSSSL